MTILEPQTNPVRRHLDVEWLASSSDLALIAAAAGGDTAAEAELRGRHLAAVGLLADVVGAELVQQAWERLAEEIRSGSPVTAPVRVRWLVDSLALHEPVGCRDHDDAIWSAFAGLSPAWQTALWHAEVEYDDAPEVARLLGLPASQSAGVVARAITQVRRAVVLRSVGGSGPECDELTEDLRASRDLALSSSLVRRLREHGRHCDECLPVAREVFRVQHSLRDILAAHVLGRHAAEYLRTRPRTRATALVPSRVSAPAALVRRSGRPALGVLVSGLTAAVVVGAFTVAVPELGSSTPATAAPVPPSAILSPEPSAPQTASPVTRGRPIASMGRAEEGRSVRAGASAGSRGGDEASGAGDQTAAGPAPETSPQESSQDEAAPGAPDVPMSTDPSPVDPPAPVGPVDETPDGGVDPGQTPAPDPGGDADGGQQRLVDVDVDQETGSVGVTVELPVGDVPPIVIATPPLLPVSGLGLRP